MDNKKKFIIILLFLFSAGCRDNSGRQSEFSPYPDSRIPALMNRYDIPGASVAIIKKGRIIYTGAYGYADISGKRKMTTDTVCMMHSISKSVTAWGVMKLAERNVIELDKPIQNYIKNWEFPEGRFNSGNITVRQLLTHSSGMPLGTLGLHYHPEEFRPSLRESLSKEAVPADRPGSSFAYSNVGFNLLELLIEEVTGRSFSRYMKSEVFIPLGMKHSDFTWRRDFYPTVPTGYDLHGTAVPVFVYAGKASGGLFSTVEDVALFAAASMREYNRTGENVLKAKSIDEIHTPMVKIPGLFGTVFDFYGLGHFIEYLPNGMKAVSHGGQGLGWMTHFHFVPETGDGIVIIANSQRSWPLFAYILNDWAAWCGFSSVKMGRIIYAEITAWVIIFIINSAGLFYLMKVIHGIIRSKRRLVMFKAVSPLRRSMLAGLSISLMSVIIWSANQDYLFINSILPAASGVLAYSICFLSMVFLLLSLFPESSLNPPEEGV